MRAKGLRAGEYYLTYASRFFSHARESWMDERVTRVKRLKTSSPKGVWGVIEGESEPITHFVLIPSSGLAEVSTTHTEKNGVESFFLARDFFLLP